MTGRAVFVDTGPWIAGFHRPDQYHASALSTFGELRRRRTPLIVTDLVLAEVHVHILRIAGPKVAAEILETVKADPLVQELFVDAAVQGAAIGDWLLRFEDQDFTFTDAVSFAVMDSRRIPTAFTFDRHFSVAGFDVVPA